MVAVACSAGGLDALSAVLGGLPAGFPAVILVVQHVAPDHRNALADILGRRTALPVKQAEEGESARAGAVFLAPPGFHLLLARDGTLTLSGGPQEHHARPAADPLFRSIAAYGPRAAAVVLTGGGRDGSAGAAAVAAAGGVVLVQHPAGAFNPGMPRWAITTVPMARVLPLPDIAPALIVLTGGRPPAVAAT